MTSNPAELNTNDTPNSNDDVVIYDDAIVKKFLLATLIWGAVALLLGVLIATQLVLWKLNLGLPWTSFGRLRPLHTNAAIFAFAGNGVFAAIYYSSQRLLKTRMYSDRLSAIHFWGWQAIIVAAALTLPLGLTVGKEYAELEWPIAWTINGIWVVFAFNYFRTLQIRRERHLYVAIWFYIATIVTVALLHVLNTINVPVSFWKSYPIYSGVQDALVQWWYGHNAVAFVLTTPFLGLMYYFLPKAADRPVYSYRLSILHFWSLVFIYIWAGPHHLLYTALPDWAQTLGMVFSVMLLAPSWGGMINGLLTLRGVWDRVRTEPVLKFFVAGHTFEGPLLSIKSVSALGHYTDWIIGHVHGGALGWNGFIIFAMSYWLIPKLWKTELYSQRLANAHFWIGLLGTVLYLVSMWIAGITQGLMWKATNALGQLIYPDFVETMTKILPLYWVRIVGGLLYFLGFILLLINAYQTIRRAPKGVPVEKVRAPRLSPSPVAALGREPHRILEGLPGLFTVLSLVTVLVGSFFELAPTFFSAEFAPTSVGLKPYTGLQLHGRDIYVREGCYTCHSQMIRTLNWETKRYGDYSRAEESIYDRPFQWGSKRTGPDLARIGGKYPDLWHYRHMSDPREMVPSSIMPTYPWLYTARVDFEIISKKLAVMKSLGVPYSDQDVQAAEAMARSEAKRIADSLRAEGVGSVKNLEETEILALIAYLQRLGSDFKKGAIR